MNSHTKIPKTLVPWNKGRLVGQKAPLKLKDIWAIRIRLQLAGKVRDLALLNLAIDSKLRGCDLVSLRVFGYRPGQGGPAARCGHGGQNAPASAVRYH
jgi:hypothetical protein